VCTDSVALRVSRRHLTRRLRPFFFVPRR
jgi:hypothetical protein